MKTLDIFEKEIEHYNTLNNIAKPDSVILFGSTFAKTIPVGELNKSMNLDCDIYNRSFTDLSVFDAEALIEKCVFPLQPKKIVLQLGETDLERGSKTIPEIINKYKELIQKIKSFDDHCKIVIASIGSSSTDSFPITFNEELKKMAKDYNCRYVDITSAFNDITPPICAFRIMKLFLINHISFYDAMNA